MFTFFMIIINYLVLLEGEENKYQRYIYLNAVKPVETESLGIRKIIIQVFALAGKIFLAFELVNMLKRWENRNYLEVFNNKRNTAEYFKMYHKYENI